MCSEIVLEVKNVSKSYKAVLGIAGAPNDRPAVSDFSLNVRRGESVGIIGHNGAGKSTILKIISGIAEPDQGSVKVRGRLAAVVGLAAGFNADLTGRENIFVRGALLGQTRSNLNKRLDWIIDFADIGDYIDMPIRTYSKGMRARLGFAVTFSFDPEILVVDETMAAGDELFKRKAFSRLHEIRRAGSTILLVTHSLGQIVDLCSRAVLMDQGEVLGESDPLTIRKRYQTLMLSPSQERPAIRRGIQDELQNGVSQGEITATRVPSTNPGTLKYSRELPSRTDSATNGGRIRTVSLHDSGGKKVGTANFLSDYELRVRLNCKMVFSSGEAQFTIFGANEQPIASCVGALVEAKKKALYEIGDIVEFSAFFENRLGPGDYTVDCSVYGYAANDAFLIHKKTGAVRFAVMEHIGAIPGVVNLGQSQS